MNKSGGPAQRAQGLTPLPGPTRAARRLGRGSRHGGQGHPAWREAGRSPSLDSLCTVWAMSADALKLFIGMKPKLCLFHVLLMLLVSKNPLARLRAWKLPSCVGRNSPEKRHQQPPSTGRLRGSAVHLPCAHAERGRVHSTVGAPVRLPSRGGGRQQTPPPVLPPLPALLPTLCSALRAPWAPPGGPGPPTPQGQGPARVQFQGCRRGLHSHRSAGG